MTSVNLATTLALSGQRVVLIDGDLRRPMVATVFGVAARREGFASVLTGAASLDEALVEAPGHGDRLQLLLASPEHAHVVDLLESGRIEAVLGELRVRTDAVIIDSPPLTEVADALALADASDGVVVAVRLGRTRRDRLDELRRMLGRHGLSPLGFVVTQRRRARPGAYHATYGVAVSEGEPVLAPADPAVRDPEAV
jgi:capsular exopolysaccharide synthesis family protein